MGRVVDMVTIVGNVTNTGVNVIIYSIIPQTTLSARMRMFVHVVPRRLQQITHHMTTFTSSSLYDIE